MVRYHNMGVDAPKLLVTRKYRFSKMYFCVTGGWHMPNDHLMNLEPDRVKHIGNMALESFKMG